MGLERSDLPGLRLVERLAVGGMAELFIAERAPAAGSPARVVVKRVLPTADAALLARFGREREALSAVASPHVVACLGGGPGYLVLELVEGSDLEALVGGFRQRGRRLPLGACAAVLEGVSRGLADLHRATASDGRPLGLVHRDVNPSNVLIGRDGSVKVSDLGVVQVGLEGVASLGGLVGTLLYMAPEQLCGAPVDQRTDLYALGLVAYEVLSGVPARPAGLVGLTELIAARSLLPRPASSHRPELGPRVDEVLAWALAPDPAARAESVQTWWAELVRALPEPPDRAALVESVGRIPRATPRAPPTLRALGARDPGPARAPRAGSPALWGASIALALGGVVAWVTSLDPPGRAPDPAVAVSVPAAAQPEVVPSFEPDVASPRDTAPDGWALEAQATPPPDASPEEAPERRPREAARPPARLSEATPFAARLTIRVTAGGPLHVSGGGARGLAPAETGLLPEGATLLQLRAPDDLRIPLRLTQTGGRLTATLGAPSGTWYEAHCGGGSWRQTPLVALRVDKTLACQVRSQAGQVVGFELVPTPGSK